jgi:hypothetical protein
MSDDRRTEFRKRVTPESFLRVLPTPFATPGPGGEMAFTVVPEEVSDRDRALAAQPPWRVTLTYVQNPDKILALELHGDVTLGSSDQPDAELDVNLLDMEEKEQSVSGRHIKLRPGKDRLFVLDLGSRNGTYANGSPITPTSAYALQDGDLLTLGRLHLRAKIVQRPAGDH